MRATVILFAALAFLWVLLSGQYSIPDSGHFHGLVAFLGVLSCAGVVAINARVGRTNEDDTSYRAIWRIPLYLPWLFWQVVLSSISVSRVILTPRMPIQPQMLRVPTGELSDFGIAVYANSITLTPGTLTLDVRNQTMLIHALTDEAARDLESGEMGRRVAALDVVTPDRATDEGRP